MKKIIFALFILTACLFLINGCGRQNVLARIDGEVITPEEFQEKLQALPEHYRNLASEDKEDFLDKLITEKLLYREALAKDFLRDPEVKNMIEEAKKRILIAKLIDYEIEQMANVSQSEIQEYYEKNKERFKLGESVRASHILVSSEEEAKDIFNRIKNGADFSALAKERSIDKASAKNGGDLGYFTRGKMIKEFEDAAFALGTEQTSDIVKSPFGYHIIKVTGRKEARTPELFEVTERIKKEILETKRAEAFDTYIKKLKDNAMIQINKELLSEKKEPKDE